MSPLTETRPVNEVYTVATDCRVLSIVKQPGLAVDAALLPGKMSDPAKSRTMKTVSLNGHWQAYSTHLKTRETDTKSLPVVAGLFPPVSDILPRFGKSSSIVVRLDAVLLANLAATMTNDNGKGVDMIIETTKRGGEPVFSASPIGVLGVNGFGVIMPLGFDREEAATYRNHSIDTYNQLADGFRANLEAVKNQTDERRAQVLAILNPQAETQSATVCEIE